MTITQSHRPGPQCGNWHSGSKSWLKKKPVCETVVYWRFGSKMWKKMGKLRLWDSTVDNNWGKNVRQHQRTAKNKKKGGIVHPFPCHRIYGYLEGNNFNAGVRRPSKSSLIDERPTPALKSGFWASPPVTIPRSLRPGFFSKTFYPWTSMTILTPGC